MWHVFTFQSLEMTIKILKDKKLERTLCYHTNLKDVRIYHLYNQNNWTCLQVFFTNSFLNYETQNQADTMHYKKNMVIIHKMSNFLGGGGGVIISFQLFFGLYRKQKYLHCYIWQIQENITLYSFLDYVYAWHHTFLCDPYHIFLYDPYPIFLYDPYHIFLYNPYHISVVLAHPSPNIWSISDICEIATKRKKGCTFIHIDSVDKISRLIYVWF